MIDNTDSLKRLLVQRKIRLQDNEILHNYPPPLPKTFLFDKVEGMLLGLAIGDALGATSEGMEPAERHHHCGEIRSYFPGKHSNFRAVGVATDDTQLSFWTLEQLLDDGGLEPDNLARKFCKYRIRGIGNTTKQFIANYKDNHIPWYESGIDSLGNGALMRIAPVVLPYLRHPHPSLWADAALDTMITHNAFANTATCVSFVSILWDLLSMTSVPEPDWWIKRFCSTARHLEGSTSYNPTGVPHYKGMLSEFVAEKCQEALRKRLSVESACQSWGSGANLFETVPSVLYILANYAGNAEEAVIRAVNDTVDNDTIAAVVGAAVGALHGLAALPEQWVKNLDGKIREGGSKYQVFRLILLAKQAFWLEGK
jgi:ADP-ribosyl-[dinitrogen reductase] hydrolase